MDYKDGYVTFRDFKTYYKIFGPADSQKTSLLVLHGGPGSAHNYLLSLAQLANDRQVVFYDQLGGGLSDRPTDNTLWSFELFLDELATVRDQLHLTEIHLLGHSWGGMLAIEYLLGKPTGIKSAILASAMVSMPLYQTEVEKLKKDLPAGVYRTLAKHEAAGTTDSEAYAKAMVQYAKRYMYRRKVYPEAYLAPKNSSCKASYNKLWGASEAYANGTLQRWDRISRLQEIAVPTLITCGQYDELTPQQAVITHDAIPQSRLRIFTTGSHLAHVECEQEYVQTVRDFLDEVA